MLLHVELLLRLTIQTDGLSLVGNDLRKAVADGYPIESSIASDLHSGMYARTLLIKCCFLSQICPLC
jgi:hypothetical protein